METSRSDNWFTTIKRIERSALFQGFIIGIIVVAALTVGAKTYSLPYGIDKAINFLDNFITVFFLAEISLRFIACDDKRGFFKDPWNIFDTVIVIGSLMPISDSEMVVVARLLRVFRVLRLVSIIPDLRFLINALLKAIPKMGYIALLMFIIFYIFAAVGSLFFHQVNETLWGDIAISMLTLFRVATFEDWTDYRNSYSYRSFVNIFLGHLVYIINSKISYILGYIKYKKQRINVLTLKINGSNFQA
ncbi:ion transporter [Marinomonas lutimaris]|uniref:ion transporter n=1 Tax=Marinomonas lutimaris TaxID=2846746 RepID=UPI002017D6BE|nr:ion transporter [Marinomonas lutimaris]